MRFLKAKLRVMQEEMDRLGQEIGKKVGIGHFISLSVSKSCCDLVVVVVVVIVVKFITQKVFNVSTPNLEYWLIMTRCSCIAKDINLIAIFLELCPFYQKILIE